MTIKYKNEVKETGFTEAEKKVWDKLVEAQNAFLELEPTHESEMNEWAQSIHDCQMLLSMRILRR